MAKDSRLELRIDSELKQLALAYATRHRVPLSTLVERHLLDLLRKERRRVKPPRQKLVPEAEQI